MSFWSLLPLLPLLEREESELGEGEVVGGEVVVEDEGVDKVEDEGVDGARFFFDSISLIIRINAIRPTITRITMRPVMS